MDNVQRLIALLLLLTAITANTALAATYTPPVVFTNSATYGGGTFTTMDAACVAGSKYLASQIGKTFGTQVACATSGSIKRNNLADWIDVSGWPRWTDNSNPGGLYYGNGSQTCKAGETKGGDYPNLTCTNACSANQTFDPATGTCKAVCASGEVVSSGYYDGGKSPSGSFPNVSCHSGCSVMFQGTWPFSQSNQPDGMHYYAKGSYVKDGFTCSASGTSPSASSSVPKSVEQQAADAAAAQAAADKAAKAAADKAAADAKTAADKAAAASAASAAEAAKQAADEAIKKAQESKDAAAKAAGDPNSTQAEKDAANAKAAADKAAADAAKQGAATAAGAAAAAQKDDTKPEPKDFCEKNPTSFICKTSSVNSGYCSPSGTVSGFSCDSDPVFCSMAKTQLDAYCLQNSRDEALVAEYNTMKTENGNNSPANSAKVTNINLPTSLNASSPYGAQCNPDVTVHVASSSVTLPFSAWCPYLNALGYLFLSMAYISAAVIISRI